MPSSETRPFRCRVYAAFVLWDYAIGRSGNRKPRRAVVAQRVGTVSHAHPTGCYSNTHHSGGCFVRPGLLPRDVRTELSSVFGRAVASCARLARKNSYYCCLIGVRRCCARVGFAAISRVVRSLPSVAAYLDARETSCALRYAVTFLPTTERSLHSPVFDTQPTRGRSNSSKRLYSWPRDCATGPSGDQQRKNTPPCCVSCVSLLLQ